jgi:hypothetical protein
MSDMLREGLQCLADLQKASQSVSVTYRRGTSASIQGLLATVGHTEQGFGAAAGGVQVRRTEKDFIVSVSDLVLFGVQATPLPGDFIDVVENAVTNRYEVVPPDEGAQCFRRDEYGIRFRIHTRFFKTL